MKLRFSLLLAIFSSLIVGFILLPIVVTISIQLYDYKGLMEALKNRSVWNSILLTYYAALISTLLAVIFATPLAYVLARYSFPFKNLIEGIADVPVVIPHTVAGIALLAVFGSNGLIGRFSPIKFVDALPGIVVAMLFVSVPIYLNTAKEGFASVDVRLEQVARTLGASQIRVFFTVSFPLAIRHIAAGAIMAWARAISEFGAIVVIAYYPMVAPTLIYDRFLASGLSAARPVAVILIILSLIIFAVLRMVAWRRS